MLFIPNNRRSIIGGGYCPQAIAYFQRVTAALDSNHKRAYDRMIRGLVADGNYNRIDALYIFCTSSTTAAFQNIISSSFTCTKTGTATFNVDDNITGDGTTGFLDTGLGLSTATNFSQDGGWMVAAVGGSRSGGDVGGMCIMGAGTTVGNHTNYIFPCFSNILFAGINDAGNTQIANTNGFGMFAVARTSSAAEKIYRNKSVLLTSANVSATAPVRNLYLLAQNKNGSAANFSSDPLRAAAVGGGAIGDTQVGQISDRINTYLATFGKNVY